MLYIVIPAFNEEGNLTPLIQDIAKIAETEGLKYTIIIVDDGSTDDTPRVIKNLSNNHNILPLQNQPNMGLGRTMAKGLKKAAEISSANDIIVTLDGDATHDPIYIPALIEKINMGKDVVIASRFAPGGFERGLSSYRKFLSRGAGWLLKIFFPTKELRDYTCGYRAFTADIIKRGFSQYGDGFIQEAGFSATPEILLKLRLLDAKFDEVGFVLKYDKKVGRSKIKLLSTIKQYIKMIVRLRVQGVR